MATCSGSLQRIPWRPWCRCITLTSSSQFSRMWHEFKLCSGSPSQSRWTRLQFCNNPSATISRRAGPSQSHGASLYKYFEECFRPARWRCRPERFWIGTRGRITRRTLSTHVLLAEIHARNLSCFTSPRRNWIPRRIKQWLSMSVIVSPTLCAGGRWLIPPSLT